MIGSGTFQKASRVRTWTLVLLVAGALLGDAVWHWAPAVQLPLAILLIAGLGLQHGALDHILHAHMHGDPEGPLRQSFALPYIAGIGVAWFNVINWLRIFDQIFPDSNLLINSCGTL